MKIQRLPRLLTIACGFALPQVLSQQAHLFPEHWGEVPAIQTRDIRPLPGGYGSCSSFLVSWITQYL